MALTANPVTADPIKSENGTAKWYGDISFDGSYPSGGYETPTNMKIENKFRKVQMVTFQYKNGYMPWWDFDTEKIRVNIGAGTEMEVVAGSDLSGITELRIKAEGLI